MADSAGESSVLYVTHNDPVGLGRENYIANVDLGVYGMAGQIEQVWLKPCGDGIYQMMCIPFCIYGISYLDRVRLDHSGMRVNEIAASSGHRTFRVLFKASHGTDWVDEKMDLMLRAAHELELLHELHGREFVAIDVPPGRNIELLLNLVSHPELRDGLHREWSDSQEFIKS